MVNMTTFIQAGAILHFGTLLGSALVPGKLEWRRHLTTLPPLLRHLIWVHGAFIVLVIIGFGAISILFPHELASRSPLARGVCAFISIFWLARLVIQLFLFDAKPYLTTALLAVGYHGLTIVFTLLVVIYGCAAIGAAHIGAT